jgi:hypothetical protein
VGIDMVDGWIVKHPPDNSIRLARLDKGSVDHHAAPVEGAKRQDSAIKTGRNFTLISQGFRGALANENRMTRPIRVIAVV